MSVERKEDGSITIRNGKGVTVIGRLTGVRDSGREEKYQRWVDDCAKLIKASSHTPEETKEYFLQLCDALPISPDDRRMKNFQLNIIMNYFKDKLVHQVQNFSFDMTDEEIEKWYREDNAMREEALNYSPEHFGLKMHGYYLPHTERNEIFYEEAHLEAQNRMQHSKFNAGQAQIQDICFYFEETTGHCQSSGGGEALIKQMIVFRGVSEEDIEKRSPRYLGYISTLRETGELPDFMGEE